MVCIPPAVARYMLAASGVTFGGGGDNDVVLTLLRSFGSSLARGLVRQAKRQASRRQKNKRKIIRSLLLRRKAA